MFPNLISRSIIPVNLTISTVLDLLLLEQNIHLGTLPRIGVSEANYP
jgi:hypothetical protein